MDEIRENKRCAWCKSKQKWLTHRIMKLHHCCNLPSTSQRCISLVPNENHQYWIKKRKKKEKGKE